MIPAYSCKDVHFTPKKEKKWLLHMQSCLDVLFSAIFLSFISYLFAFGRDGEILIILVPVSYVDFISKRVIWWGVASLKECEALGGDNMYIMARIHFKLTKQISCFFSFLDNCSSSLLLYLLLSYRVPFTIKQENRWILDSSEPGIHIINYIIGTIPWSPCLGIQTSYFSFHILAELLDYSLF